MGAKAYTSKELIQMRERIARMDRRKRFPSGKRTYVMRWGLDDDTPWHSLKLKGGGTIDVDTLPLAVADAYADLRRRLGAWAENKGAWPMGGLKDSGDEEETRAPPRRTSSEPRRERRRRPRRDPPRPPPWRRRTAPPLPSREREGLLRRMLRDRDRVWCHSAPVER